MEDIRTYLDSTGDRYHKGETQFSAALCGLIYLGTALLWLAVGTVYLIWFAPSFDEASGALAIGAPTSTEAWALGFLRPLFGLFLGWLGLMAWDMRRGFLYWAWLVGPAYAYYWWGLFSRMDPEFRSRELAPENLFTYPVAYAVGFSVLALLAVLPITALTSWAFRKSAKDFHPLVVVVLLGMGWFAYQGFTGEFDEKVKLTPMVACVAPLDHPASGLPTLKLIALTHADLRCHGHMDQLTEALTRFEEGGRSIAYRNWGNRPKGERLMRMLEQGADLAVGLECPEGGYYSIDKVDGHWRCSQHGDRLPPADRRIGDIDARPDDGYE